MANGFDDIQKLSKDGVDKAVASFGAVQKGLQTLTTEITENSKKTFEANSAFVEKLLGVKTLEKAVELQTAFAKESYETFVAQATKMNELFVDIAKNAVKPYEVVAK